MFRSGGLPPFLAGLLGRQIRDHEHQPCGCVAQPGGSGRSLFLGPDGGHYQRSNRTPESVPRQKLAGVARSAPRKLTRQTGYKLRDDQQNRSRASPVIVPCLRLGRADLRHPRGLHGSQHVHLESDSHFVARAIPG